jgi:hypothetical protein
VDRPFEKIDNTAISLQSEQSGETLSRVNPIT